MDYEEFQEEVLTHLSSIDDLVNLIWQQVSYLIGIEVMAFFAVMMISIHYMHKIGRR